MEDLLRFDACGYIFDPGDQSNLLYLLSPE